MRFPTPFTLTLALIDFWDYNDPLANWDVHSRDDTRKERGIPSIFD